MRVAMGGLWDGRVCTLCGEGWGAIGCAGSHSVESALPGRNAEHTILAVFCERFGAVARTGSVLYIPLEWWRTVKPYSMNENKQATHGTA